MSIPLQPALPFFLSTTSGEDNRREIEPLEAALAAYEEAIQLVPHEGIFYYHKGVVLERIGRHTEARQAFEEARLRGFQGKRHTESMDFTRHPDAELPYANAGHQ